MTAHIRVPALTGDAPGHLQPGRPGRPAPRRVGFTGAVVTDALEMKGAALAAGGVGPGAVRALAAGRGPALHRRRRSTPRWSSRWPTRSSTAVTDGRLPLARLEEAAGRDAGAGRPGPVRSRRAPSPRPTSATPPRAEPSGSKAASTAWPGRWWCSCTPAPPSPQGRVPWGLGPHLDDGAELRVVAAETDPATLRALAGTRPIVVVGRQLHRLPGSARRCRRAGRRAPGHGGGDGLAVSVAAGRRPRLRHHLRRKPRQRPGRGRDSSAWSRTPQPDTGPFSDTGPFRLTPGSAG